LSTENVTDPVGEETPIKENSKYSSRNVTLVGYDDCGGCIKTEAFINGDLMSNSDVPVNFKKIIADSAEGVAIVKDKKLKTVPYIEECLIPTDPTQKPECTEYKSFKKSDFKFKVNS
jgi:hypothetical protein